MIGDQLGNEESPVLPDELDELWHDYRRSLARRGRAPSTIHLYRKTFVAFWEWAASAGVTLDPDAIDYKVINRWTDDLALAPATRNGQPILETDPETGERRPKLLEASTRRIMFRNLRPFFSWWAKETEATNPFARADAPGDDRPSPIPIVQLDDVRALLAVCSGKDFAARRDNAIIRVFADTGARLGELVGLGVDDWDRRQDMLLLTGKTGSRVTPVSLSTGEALSRYLRERKTQPHASLPAMWLGKKGKLGDSGIAQLLYRRCEQAGIEPINPHRFRHTWAHEFRSQGGSEGDLMYLAGWSSTAMAHRYGNSAAAERAQKAARSLSLGDRL